MEDCNETAGMGSPMDLVFSWSEPRNKDVDVDSKTRRKFQEDSGYFATPCSSQSRINISSGVNTPDDGFISECSLIESTPLNKLRDKKRPCEIYKLESPVKARRDSTDIDSFSEFALDTSFYGQPEVKRDSVNDDSEPVPLPVSPEVIKRIPDCDSPLLKSSVSPRRRTLLCKKRLSPLKKISRSRDLPRVSSRSSSLNKENFSFAISEKKGSLEGTDHIDFLYLFGVRFNFKNLLSTIFSHLSDEDISNMTLVSKTWYNVCNDLPEVRYRWLSCITNRKEIKENLPMMGKKRLVRTPLLAVNQSSPMYRRSPSSPPVSPSKFRFNLFQKEAAKLKDNERLVQCPRCTMPSRYTPGQNLGQCTRLGCRMEFCTTCHSPFHDPSPCVAIRTPGDNSPQKISIARISSRQSRRMLRRL